VELVITQAVAEVLQDTTTEQLVAVEVAEEVLVVIQHLLLELQVLQIQAVVLEVTATTITRVVESILAAQEL
jgi:hypothetical protein